MNTEQALFALIRNVICGEAVSEETRSACTGEMLNSVYTLAARHDLAHLVGQAISKLGLPDSEILTKCKQAGMSAFVRHMRLDHEYQKTCKALEEAQIPFLPLKGSVLRDHYPEAWMRTSCDADILVKETDLDAAATVLKANLGYRFTERSGHDMSFYSPGGIHIELHFDLVEDGRANASAAVLSRVWEDATPADGFRYWHRMSDRFFYFYHIAHMAKHFETGGCGIRPFIDLWLLDNVVKGDPAARDDLLQTGGLLQFATAVRKLGRVWFSGEAADALSQRLEYFLLHGGAFGSVANRVALHKKEDSSQLRYLLSRVFVPYEKLKAYYPILEKHRWLMPVMQVRRWFLLLKPDVYRRTKGEVLASKTMVSDANDIGTLLNDLGLDPAQW